MNNDRLQNDHHREVSNSDVVNVSTDRIVLGCAKLNQFGYESHAP